MPRVEFKIDTGPQIKQSKVRGYYVCKWCPLGGESGYQKLGKVLCSAAGFEICNKMLAEVTLPKDRVKPTPPLR